MADNQNTPQNANTHLRENPNNGQYEIAKSDIEQQAEVVTYRAPDYTVYTVREGNNGKAYWGKLGAAYYHKDGNGLTIDVNSHSLDGRYVLRHRSENAMANRDRSPKPSQTQTQDRGHGPER